MPAQLNEFIKRKGFPHYFLSFSLWAVSAVSSPLFATEDDVVESVSSSPSEEAVKAAENINLKAVVSPLVEVPLEPLPQAVSESHQPQEQSSGQKAEKDSEPAVSEAVPEGVQLPEKDGLEAPVEQMAEPVVAEAPPPQVKPLRILGTNVLPGTSTRLSWSPGASFVGISAPTPVLVLNGVKPGPTLCLTGAVHGDEINGIEVVRRVVYNIDPLKLSGSVIGVPIVNLQGFRRGSRYLPDRRDLNRFFPGNPEGSSASRIAYSFFTQVVSHCDMLVDLHTGSFRRTNMPQLRADLTHSGVKALAQKMGAIVVVHSEGSEGTLRRSAVMAGIPAVTVEAGAPNALSATDIEHGVKSIESAMDSLGMIKRRRFWEREAEPVYYESTWVRAREGGMLLSEVSLGEEVSEGDVLGVLTDPITNARSEILAPFDGQIIGMALNQVMFPGFAAYHLGHRAIMPTTGPKPHVQESPVMDTATSEPMDVAPVTSASDGDDEHDPDIRVIPIEDSE